MNLRDTRWSVFCLWCGGGGAPVAVAERRADHPDDARLNAQREAEFHAEQHERRRQAVMDAPRHAEQAAALQWTEAQANAMLWADRDWLHYDRAAAVYFKKDMTDPRATGRGRTVAKGRVEALITAGFLTCDGSSVTPTADGHAARRAWIAAKPEPVAKEQELRHLRPLIGGQEEMRQDAERAARIAEAAAERAERARWTEPEPEDAPAAVEKRAAITADDADQESSFPAVHDPNRATVEPAAAAAVPERQPAPVFEQIAVSVAGPGIIGPGTRVEYVDQSRKWRRKHESYGAIVAIGRTCVTWKPGRGGRGRTLRTPLQEMRVDWCGHEVADVDPRHPSSYRYWTGWTLAQHLEFRRGKQSADEQSARTPQEAPAHAQEAEQLTLFAIEPENGPQGSQKAPTGPLAVIPCSAGKLSHEAPAGELYTGSYHAACRRAADALTAAGGTILILSARHGFLRLDEMTAPYNTRMGEPGSITATELRAQARRMGIADADTVTILAGAAYAAAAQAVWPNAATPLAGTRGIGQQRARLAALARTQFSTAA
ncbi:DUF6884 domain-containing protein [Streptomyces decoyicus]|uniref:DUF6884 domain-containing protein n=1 Tax=Streptomyces decoyicus TaxID=249567 RepID=UPI0036296CF8